MMLLQKTTRAKGNGSKDDRNRRAPDADQPHLLSVGRFRCVWRIVRTIRERQGLSYEVQPTP